MKGLLIYLCTLIPDLHGTLLHETVMDEYVVWAKARARGAGLKQFEPFWVFEYDKVLNRLMKARGFIEVHAVPAPPLFERSLDELPPMMLPEGFTVHAVGNLADGRLRAQVTYGAFSPDDDWETFAAEYAQFIGSAVYDGERDLFVRSPEGRGESACTIWYDPVNAVGLFEPVATHPINKPTPDISSSISYSDIELLQSSNQHKTRRQHVDSISER